MKGNNYYILRFQLKIKTKQYDQLLTVTVYLKI